MKTIFRTLAIFLTLPALAAQAQTAAAAAESPLAPGAHVCGGVGADDREQMRSVGNQYNLHLRFAEAQTGSYLANVAVQIEPMGKKMAAQAYDLGPYENCGPLLYVHLPPGRYRVNATQAGVTKTTTVQVGRRAVEQVLYWPKSEQ